MNLKEIESFEDLWKKLWEIIYAVIAFFRDGKGGKDTIEVGTDTVKFDSVNPVVY